MDNFENTQAKIVIESDVSRFVGPDVQVVSSTAASVRHDYAGVPEDSIDWSKRLFCINELQANPLGYSVGPAFASFGSFMLMHLFERVEILRMAAKKYWAFRYDDIEVRYTVSNPKNLVGGLHVGWIPYQDYYDKDSVETFDEIFGSDLLTQGLYNGPYTHQMLYGMAKDTMFTIPWSFKTPVMSTKVITYLDESDPNHRAAFGSPCIWWSQLPGTAYVTSVVSPARLQIYTRFRGLKFYGPTNQDLTATFDLQSGAAVEAVAAVAAATVGADLSEMANSVLETMLPKETENETAMRGTYDLPQTVQMAYCGDTSSMDYANSTPIFFEPVGTHEHVPTIHETLSRPQYIGYFTSATSDFTRIVNDPMSFYSGDAAVPPFNKATYFRWYGMLNRYWRGSIIVWLVTAGHPLVEVQMETFVTYPYYQDIAVERAENVCRQVSVFNTCKCIKVILPFLTTSDYLPVYDAYPSDSTDNNLLYTSQLSASLRVVSTSLNVAPVIPCYIYVSAGPDFAFYQPIPPGLYNAELNDVEEVVSLPIIKATPKEQEKEDPIELFTLQGGGPDDDDPFDSDDEPNGVIALPSKRVQQELYMMELEEEADAIFLLMTANAARVLPYDYQSGDRNETRRVTDTMLNSETVARRESQRITDLLCQCGDDEYFDEQVFIPLEGESEYMHTRHSLTSDPGTMIHLPTVYDYLKLWSRCVPFYDYDNDGDQEPIPDADVGLKCATWYPPVDRSSDEDVNNSWYFTLDYIAYFAMQYVFYRGSMGFKFCLSTDPDLRDQEGYVYVSLSGPNQSYRQKTHCPWGADAQQVPPESNFGAGTVLTPIGHQPILECAIPYRGSNTWSYCINNSYYRPNMDFWQVPNASVSNNLWLHKVEGSTVTLADAMFRKAGLDFAFGFETILPPPTMWIARGFDWKA